MNLRFNKTLDRTGSFKRKGTCKLQCLCKMHRCVELWSIECVRDKVRDTDSDYMIDCVMRKPSRCWLGAVPRYWNSPRLTVVPRLGVRLASSNKVAGQRVR